MTEYYKNLNLDTIVGEEWLDVVGWEDLYAISSFGRVKSKERKCHHYRGGIQIKQERILRQNNGRGYLTVLLYRGEIDKMRTGVHRLMAKAFIPNYENKPTVNHKDTIKTHNVLSNLEWATDEEQQIHAVAMGLRNNTLGESNNLSKLKKEDIINIRSLYGTNDYFQREIADMFGITEEHCHRIVNKKAWKHV